MNLLTLGDSFTYGEELQDLNQCWPQQLASIIGYDLINLATPSNSGPAICRQLVQHIALGIENKPDLVIIGWPSPGRVEYSDESGYFNIWPGYSGNLFKQNQPWRMELLSYLNRYHNSSDLFESFLQNIVFTQHFLEGQNIPYLMLNVVANEYYINTYSDKFKFYDKLINFSRFIGWNERNGMLEWTESENCPVGEMGHFLEQGHKIVAEKINEHIRNLGWLP
jgi:hypothetical protein